MASLAGLIFGAVAEHPYLGESRNVSSYCYKPLSLVWASA